MYKYIVSLLQALTQDIKYCNAIPSIMSAVSKAIELNWSCGLHPKYLEAHRCAISTIITNDALVVNHRAISIHSADLVFIVLHEIHTWIFYIVWITWEPRIKLYKNETASVAESCMYIKYCLHGLPLHFGSFFTPSVVNIQLLPRPIEYTPLRQFDAL